MAGYNTDHDPNHPPTTGADAMTETIEITEVLHGEIPSYLAVGEICGNKRYGCFVVVTVRPAVWYGEDQDIYGHVPNWFTIRPATAEERALWDAAVVARKTRRSQRDVLGVECGYAFNPKTGRLEPSSASTRRLDSYDDQWRFPVHIELTQKQAAVEQTALDAESALSGHKTEAHHA